MPFPEALVVSKEVGPMQENKTKTKVELDEEDRARSGAHSRHGTAGSVGSNLLMQVVGAFARPTTTAIGKGDTNYLCTVGT